MIRALIKDDLVTGRATGNTTSGIEIPVSLVSLPNSALKYDGSSIIDVSETTSFYIDSVGNKHIIDLGSLQQLICSHDDVLELDASGNWYVVTQVRITANSKIAELKASQKAQQVSGFTSDALGTTHTYPSDLETQSDYIGIQVAGVGGSIRCADSNGVWARRAHTNTEFGQVFVDGLTEKVTQRTLLDSKIASIEAIVDDGGLTEQQKIDQITAITW